MTHKMGTKLMCETCKSEFIVTKGGSGNMTCCGQPLQKK
ncbi:desulfoferrodoxin [Caryophanon latum]|nr:desulfoferrodoxin [Caryophanon latum]